VFQSAFGSFGTGNGKFNTPTGIAVSPSGIVYVVDTFNYRVQRFFDPTAWVSGTNVFTDPTVGPTSVGVGGSSPLLGTSFTLNSAMGLVVGDALTVSFGAFNQNGGSLAAATLSVQLDGSGSAGTFNYAGGPFNVTSTTVSGATVGQTQTAAQFNATAPLALVAGQTFTQSGGSVTIPQLTLGGSYNYIAGPLAIPAMIVQAGGSFSTTATALSFGSHQSVIVQTGGALSATAASWTLGAGDNLTVAGGAASIGSLTVGAGASAVYQPGQFGTFAVPALTIATGGTFSAAQGGVITNSTSLSLGGVMNLGGGATLVSASPTIGSAGLLNMAAATLSSTSSLSIAGGGELRLGDAANSVVATSGVSNSGTIDGSGRVNAALTNLAGGQISIATGQLLTFTGSGNTNAGTIGLSGGTLHFAQALENKSSGLVAGYGTLQFDTVLTNDHGGFVTLGGPQSTNVFGSISNSGNLNLTGSTFVFASLTNASGGAIQVAGATPNIFAGSVSNSGSITVLSDASAEFLGSYSVKCHASADSHTRNRTPETTPAIRWCG
jgi:hypothetical protein